MLLLALAVAPGVFWLWYFVRRDRIKPEPQHLIRRVFFAGAAAGILAALVELLIFSQPVMSLDAGGQTNIIAAAIVIGLVEEAAKFLAVYYTAYRHAEFNEAFDGIIYAVAAAMGFATLENIGYVLGGGYGVGAIRALLSVPGHAFFATLMGYHIGIARFSGAAEARWLVGGILWASAAHAIFDAVLLTRTVLAILVIPLVIGLWRWSLARSQHAQLLDDRRWGAGYSPRPSLRGLPGRPILTTQAATRREGGGPRLRTERQGSLRSPDFGGGGWGVGEEQSAKWVRVSDNRLRRISRRELLKVAAAGAAGVGLAGVERLTGPYIVRAQARQLRIMTWSHFVPAFDAWFDPFARAWGQGKGVQVTVDHVTFADIVPRATAEVAAQQGHDVYFFIAPPSQFEQQVLDLADINQEAEKRYGPLVPYVKNSVYNPHTRKYFGFSDNWVPDPGDYLKSSWAGVGMVNGPKTWDDLIKGGAEIKKKFPAIQIPIGVGLSQDIDSNMATRAIMWSFGASIQDKDSNVVLNSEQTVKAVEYGVRLFREVMTPAVLSWNAASNNLALNAQQTSYILNSISAYRAAQDQRLPVASDIFFTPALRGPAAAQVATHVMGVWVVWRFSRAPDLAKEFLLHLLDNYRDAVMASKLYNFPSYWGSVADKNVPLAEKAAAGRRWIRSRVFQDPFASLPPDKLKVLAESEKWSTNVGHPGTANPAEGEIFDTYVITDMFAKAATGQLQPKQAVDEADRRVKEIFRKWRQAGLVGGGRDR